VIDSLSLVIIDPSLGESRADRPGTDYRRDGSSSATKEAASTVFGVMTGGLTIGASSKLSCPDIDFAFHAFRSFFRRRTQLTGTTDG
jgi:hypothetical protein